MQVLPISNNYQYNTKLYKTNASKVPTFQGLFSKSLQDKFNDGVKALDGHSVFIFSDEAHAKYTKYHFNEIAENINIPILKTYTFIASEKELPNSELNVCFALFKKDDKYYVADLNGIGGGLEVAQNVKNYNKDNQLKESEIKELTSGDKIVIYRAIFNDKENVIFEFRPPKFYDSAEAEKYMEVHNKFSSQDVVGKFNKATVAEFSRPKSDNKSTERIFTFDDIGGLDKQKEELRKYVIRPLLYPEVYKNIRLNKGILLYGPPRCGKTLLCKALANEAKVTYKYINANEFISSEVGASEQNIRTTFDKLLSESSILFIDEFDAIGKKREGSSNSRYDDSVVNQLLGSMSDLEKSYTNSFVIAATNRKDLIDNALLSTGRFGLHLEIPMPNEEALNSIYDIYAKNQPLRKDISKPFVVEYMKDNNFNGSDVAEMFSVAYFNALDRLDMNKKMDAKIFRVEDLQKIEVSMSDLMNAIKKIGAQKNIKI